MKTLTLSLIFLLLCSGANNSQIITIKASDSISVHNIKTVPDTTIYSYPVRADLELQVDKMKDLKKEAKEVHNTSLRLQKAVHKEKEEIQAKQAMEFFKNSLVNRAE